jgi:hypothetical protein
MRAGISSEKSSSKKSGITPSVRFVRVFPIRHGRA